MVAPSDLPVLEKQRPDVPEEVHEARKKALAATVGEGQKALHRSPKMTRREEGKTVTERPKSEFSVFVQLDGVIEGDESEVGRQATRAFDRLHDLCGSEATMPHRRDLVSMTVDADTVEQIAAIPGVASVEVGDAVRRLLVTTSGTAPKPRAGDRRFSRHRARHDFGAGVIVGIIDVEGFDFAHEDFIRDGRTRFLSIWDQAGDASTGGRDAPFVNRASPRRADYGSEITKAHMDAAIAAAGRTGVPATTLEPQSSMVPGSHGTHVASIAAGNLGICRNADVVGVSLALADGDHDRRRSFYDTDSPRPRGRLHPRDR